MTTLPHPTPASPRAPLPAARPIDRWIHADRPAPAAPDRPLRIFFAGGSGDVGATLEHWARGEEDPSIISIAYSRQLFDACRALGAELMVVTDNPRTRPAAHALPRGRITVRGSRRPSLGKRGLRYHVEEIRYALWLAREAKRFGADVFIASTMIPHHALIPLARSGVKVVVSLHNTHWPRERSAALPPMTRLNRRLKGLFWRRFAHATICVSEEVERQTLELCGRAPAGPVRQVRAQYHRDRFDEAGRGEPPADGRWQLLYAGRVERAKGVADLLHALARVVDAGDLDVSLEIAGDGTFLDEAQSLARRLGVAPRVRFRGRLRQDALAEAFRRCHAVVVPTSGAFTEGLNKVCVEAALSRRPAIMTRATLADELAECGIMIPPDDPAALADAIRRLCADPDLYRAKVDACERRRERFFDRSRSWGTAVHEILADIDRQRARREP